MVYLVSWFTRLIGIYSYKTWFNENMSNNHEKRGKSKIGGQTLVRTNLGDKTNLFPLFFLCIIFNLMFIFYPQFWYTIELFAKSPCFHPIFGPPFTPYTLFKWYTQSKEILLNLIMKCWVSTFNAQCWNVIIIFI
jgi:hypothetical protein